MVDWDSWVAEKVSCACGRRGDGCGSGGNNGSGSPHLRRLNWSRVVCLEGAGPFVVEI